MPIVVPTASGRLRLACAALALVALAAGRPAAAAHLVVPVADASGATDRLFAIDLATGAIDELSPRRGGLVLDSRRLDQNLFADIGRPADSPAMPGEFLIEGLSDRSGRTRALLLVETTTGYTAYLLRPGQNGRLGEVRTVGGRPASPLAAEGGSFALLPVRDSSRREERAYLLRGEDGACLLFSGLERLDDEPRVERCPPIGPLDLAGAAAALATPSGTTTGYLVMDEADGRLVALEPAADRGDRLVAFRTEVVLASIFPPPAAGSTPPRPRFALAPIRGGDGRTEALLAVDAATGRLAWIGNLEARSRLAASLLAPQLFPLLGGAARGKSLAALPRSAAAGRTAGIWILGSPRLGALLVSDPATPADLAVQRVELRQ